MIRQTPARPTCWWPGRVAWSVLALALVSPWTPGATGQTVFIAPIPLPARGQAPEPAPAPSAGRQVTLFGVIASPIDPRIDPKLASIEPQLRRLLPGHGFRLLGAQSKRLGVNESLTCPLGDGYSAQTVLVHPFDDNGKVQLRCSVLFNQSVQLESQVSTPPNQLFFSDKLLPNGTRLLVGVGAR
ncbi:MAG: hypothetical protein U0835_16520 [Isosphaeraceae bacterium]